MRGRMQNEELGSMIWRRGEGEKGEETDGRGRRDG